MPRPAAPNLALNSRFELAAYGVGPFTTNGVFVADRWKREGGGTAARCSVAAGVTPSDQSIEKEWRAQPCLDLVFDAAWSAPTDWLTIRQRVPQGDLFGEQTVCVYAVLFGPAGTTCKVGVGADGQNAGRYTTVTLLGDTTPLVFPFVEGMGAVSNTWRTIEVCRDPILPIGGGTIKIAFGGLLYPGNEPLPGAPPIRSLAEEVTLCQRFVRALPRWHRAVGAAGDTIVVPVAFQTPMRATPTIVSPASSVTFLRTIAGTTLTSSSPSPGFDAGANKDAYGGRIVLSAFTGVVSGTEGMIQTPSAFLLEAELG